LIIGSTQTMHKAQAGMNYCCMAKGSFDTFCSSYLARQLASLAVGSGQLSAQCPPCPADHESNLSNVPIRSRSYSYILYMFT